MFDHVCCHFIPPYKYSQTSLTRTPKGQNQVSALQRCPYYSGRECMISGISGTKRTVRNRGVCKERLDCTLIRQLWIWPRFLRVPNKSAPNPALSVGVTRVQRTRFHWHTKHKFLNSVFVLGAQNERKILRKMMSYQTSSKRSPPFWLLIGPRKFLCFSAQSEARTACYIDTCSKKI